MKVGINRPNFFPWLGFMSLVDHVDRFIYQDHIAISKGNYVTRNQIKDNGGNAKWITEPRKKCSDRTWVSEVQLAEDAAWKRKLKAALDGTYAQAPFRKEINALVEECLAPEMTGLFELNVHMLECLCRHLGIQTEFFRASELVSDDYDDAEQRVIDLCLAVEGSAYFNAKDGVEKGLYVPERFKAKGLSLNKQEYTHPEYPQLHGAFVSHLSILDLLYNCGPDSLEILRSGEAYEVQ